MCFTVPAIGSDNAEEEEEGVGEEINSDRSLGNEQSAPEISEGKTPIVCLYFQLNTTPFTHGFSLCDAEQTIVESDLALLLY